MKNTKENKEKFFAQYWGQLIGYYSKHNDHEVKVSEVGVKIIDHIELSQLSNITREVATKVAKCIYNFDDLEVRIINFPSCVQIEIPKFRTRIDITLPLEGIVEPNIINIWDLDKGELDQGCYIIDMIDVLRTHGYALPWNGINIEDQVKFGWIKLI